MCNGPLIWSKSGNVMSLQKAARAERYFMHCVAAFVRSVAFV